MASKSNPQITIPRATFDELQAIAEVWGLPSPGLAVGMMVKQFGHLMKDGILPTSTAFYSAPVVSTEVYSDLQPSSVESTAIYSAVVETTADHSKSVETTGNGTPTATFLDMNF
jgi:hypothetical protein